MLNLRYRNILLLLFFISVFAACKHDKVYRVEPYYPDYNLDVKDDIANPRFKQIHLKKRKEEWVGGLFGKKQFPEWNEVWYKDSVIRIDPQLDGEPGPGTSKYSSSERSQFDFSDLHFVTARKTSFIASIPGPYNIGSRYFVFNAKYDGLVVYSLDRPTVKLHDGDETYRELLRLSPNILMVDNDYIFEQTYGNSYEIKRYDKGRIWGPFLVLSPDERTIVFSLEESLYQCHFPSGETHSLSTLPEDLDKLVKTAGKEWPYNYFSWRTNENGSSFLEGVKK